MTEVRDWNKDMKLCEQTDGNNPWSRELLMAEQPDITIHWLKQYTAEKERADKLITKIRKLMVTNNFAPTVIEDLNFAILSLYPKEEETKWIKMKEWSG